MSEELKCPFCGGTTSVAYYHTGNNLLYCHNCKRTFSERDAKIMKQAARIAELEELNELRKISIRLKEDLLELEKAECGRLREALVKLKECLEGYFGKTEKDFFEDCNEDSGELYFADVYNVAVNALKKSEGEE